MDLETFRQGLVRDGFVDAGVLPGEAGRFNPEHAHEYDVRGLVLDGLITLTVAGNSTDYRPGDVFVMDRRCRHSERNGPDGVTVEVGRRGAGYTSTG